MTEFTRRQAIEMVGAAAFAAGFVRPVFAETAATKAGIDAALAAAVKAGKVPGVVALAANDKGTIYSGAFGVRSIASPEPMTLELGVLDRLHDEGRDHHRGDADGGAGQA